MTDSITRNWSRDPHLFHFYGIQQQNKYNTRPMKTPVRLLNIVPKGKLINILIFSLIKVQFFLG